MQLPDVNVLIYAHREDAPEHERFAGWLLALTEADEPFAVSEVVLASVIRIVTNSRIFEPASPTEAAIAFCQRLVDWPRAVMIAPSRRHWDLHWALRKHPWTARDRCLSCSARDRTRLRIDYNGQ
jgi:hypothetical protein